MQNEECKMKSANCRASRSLHFAFVTFHFSFCILTSGQSEAQPGTDASSKATPARNPSVRTDFPGGQLGRHEWVGPGRLRAVLYREWDENRVNTQSTWYYFRLDGVRDVPLSIELTGLDDRYNGRPSHSIAERDKPFVSSDNVHWERLLTAQFDAKRSTLTIHVVPRTNTVWIAHLEPYTEEHLSRLAADFKGSPYLRVESAGQTVEGRDLPLWTITDPAVPESGKKVVWLMGRQHAWETHTSFCLEGAARLLLAGTPEAATLRRALLVRLLPMMDPDGVARGGTRLNRHGYDVNRHWNEVRVGDPQLGGKMPEIASAKRAIRDWLAAGHRIDLLLAFHDTQVDSFSMAPGNDPSMLKLHELMRGHRFSGRAIEVAVSGACPTVEGALSHEFGFPAGLIELGTIDLPTYGRYVTAPDRVRFGADLIAAVAETYRLK